MHAKLLQLCLTVTVWTVPHQAPLSMGFSRQEHWSGLPCLPPGDLPDPKIKPVSLISPALAGGFFTSSATWEAQIQADKRPKPTPRERYTQSHPQLGNNKGLHGITPIFRLTVTPTPGQHQRAYTVSHQYPESQSHPHLDNTKGFTRYHTNIHSHSHTHT